MSQVLLSYIINSPIITSLVMLIITHLICRWCFHDVTFTLNAGSIIMALTMFFWVCLPAYGVTGSVMIVPALTMLVVWCYVLFMYLNTKFLGDLEGNPKNSLLDLGFWVSGSALMVVLLDEAEQTLHGLIVFLGMMSIIIYLYYVVLFCGWLYRARQRKCHVYADGVLFLFSISTLSILLLLQEVINNRLPALLVHLIFCFSVFTYVIALIMVWYHHIFAHRKHFMVLWSSASVLDYGALGLMGVCLIQASLYPVWVVQVLWWFTVVLLVVTEALLLMSSVLLMRHKGFLNIIDHRSNTPWLRIFSLSICYCFALAYHDLVSEPGWLVLLVVKYGYYLITIVLVMQLMSILINLLRRYVA